ncbi:MAG: hypothetical protein GY729_21835 [Desulfobacteraceae bacterium]|nr:hypothetical protein [Desulfobacteraceae bacterium]
MKKKICLILCFFAIWFGVCNMVFANVVDRIVAIVNDDIITLVELDTILKPYLLKVEAAGYTSDKKQEVIKKLQSDALNTLVDEKLTRQEANRIGVKVSDEEVNSVLEKMMESKGLSREEFEELLSRDAMTWEGYAQKIKEQRLQAKIINQSVRSKVIITDADIKSYYDEHIDKFKGQKKYHLRNILHDNESILQEIKQKLDQNADFKTLASENSTAPNALEGGDLGVFNINMFSITIKDSIEKLEKGEYSGVIETPQGFQIFYVEDIIFENKKTLEEASEDIRETLFQELVKSKFLNWLKSLKEKAHIKIML